MKACPKYFERPSLEEAAKRSQKPIPIIRTELKIDPNLLDYTKDKKYFIQTFGCQANERDGEFLAGLLELCGYQKAKLREEADIILLNTC
ncbi:tRNA (N6-isopentenyl adenosine(37)-C2)-methylthiotransferase MiaB, partial [bacterium]|nr:tRNA (N6-isopentenyl adenosine(37)-C2)-methylthiotransferase MiaB [bacterium]